MADSDVEAGPSKKAKIFCCQTFRKEIRGNEVLKSIKNFVSAAKKSDSVVVEYLEDGGSINEILSIIDVTAKGDLTTALPVFEVVHLILLRFQSSNSKYHQHCMEGAKLIVGSHLQTIKAMLAMNTTKFKKVALKLLTVIVTLHSSFATEVMNVMSLTPAMINDLIEPTSDKDSLRKSFILFILSFLVDGNTSILKHFLEKKGYLSSIIPGLKYDEGTTVNLTLSLLEEKILKSSKIQKTLKLKIFNTQIIKALFDLYDWKGPKSTKPILPRKRNKIKEVEVNQKEKDLVVESVHSFLLLLCCSKKYGIAFSDKSMGTSDVLNNQLLLTVFESLSDPLKNQKVAEVMIKTIASCPDLMKPVLSKLEPSFQPRDSKNWFEAMNFAENLIKEVDASTLLKTEDEVLTASQITKVAKSLCTPIVLLRTGKSAAQKSHSVEIRLHSLKLLTTMWGEIQKLFSTFPKFESDLKKSMKYFFSKFLPNIEDLMELWQMLCNVNFSCSVMIIENRPLYLSIVLTCLQVIVQCQREGMISSSYLSSNLLKHVESVKEILGEKEFMSLQVKIVQFLEINHETITSNMDLFERSLLILLQSSDETSLIHASQILRNLGIFKRSKSEVDVWLICYISLSSEQRGVVASYLIESLRQILHRENQDARKTSLAPVIFDCVETLKTHSSQLEEEDFGATTFQHYIWNVIILLQHFYADTEFLFDQFKSYKKIISKSVINYLKCWKNNSLKSVDSNIFSCPHELELISWLLKENDTRPFEEVVKIDKMDILKLYSSFLTVVAYLTNKIANEDLSSEDVGKFTNALLFFTKSVELSKDDDYENLEDISCNLRKPEILQKICLSRIFSNNRLLNCFDIFQKVQSNFATIAVDVLMKNETAKKFSLRCKALVDPWKSRFLEEVKGKLIKNKPIDKVANFEEIFNFFEYDHVDVVELIDLLVSVSDSGLFMHKNKPSRWAVILGKFIQIHCLKEELNEKIVAKLCLILEHLSQEGCSNVEVVDDCFIDIIRRHPKHLVLINHDFIDVMLRRTDASPKAPTLAKLLLNDPNKVKHLLKTLSKNFKSFEESNLIFSLLSVLIIDNDPFLESISSSNVCLVWKTSEIAEKSSSKLLKVLELVFEKFQQRILSVMAGKKDEIILKNLDVASTLVKLFVDAKHLKKLKKELANGTFQAELCFEAVKKFNTTSMTDSYLHGMLVKCCRIISNSKELEEDEEILWSKYCSIISDVIKLNKDSAWENILQSSEWKEFQKLALGHCFSSSKHLSLMKILRLLTMELYKEEVKDLSFLFQLVISHSQFLNVMLSKFPLKTELVELFYCLLERVPSEMSPKHFPILLASYNASMSRCDQILLKILHSYEESGIATSNYEPFVWDEAAISHYSIGSNSGLSLWHRFNMGNVLDILDSQRMEQSLKDFPIHRGLGINDIQTTEGDLNVYDPSFLLPLFANLLSPGSVVFCIPFIYKGGLAYTVRALSSECSEIRMMASVVLIRFYNHLEMSQNLKQKSVWMHFINCFRYNIKDLLNQRLPNITTLFFARMTLELSSQPSEMYTPLQNFLLAKPSFAFDTIPEFLPLFHSSEVSYWKHREWLLEVLRDGTKTTLDLNIIYKTMALKVIFCFSQSQLCDNETKKLILQVMESIIRVEKSILLVSEYSLLNWINCLEAGSVQPMLYDSLKLLSATTCAIIRDIKVNKSRHANLTHIIQVLNMAMKALPAVKNSKSVEVFSMYIKMVFGCFILFIDEEKCNWFKLNENRLEEIVATGVAVLGEKYNCEKFRRFPFYFRNYDEDCNTEVVENLKRVVILFRMLVNKTNENKSE